jgi:tRNA (mo5U34)-methyltransferase
MTPPPAGAPPPLPVRELRRRQNDFTRELAEKGWFHSFELPDGTRIEGCMPLAWQRQRWSRFPIPADLSGKRLLDIGAWDGWFSFEAERRGAAVTSVDCFESAGYLQMHARLGSRAEFRNLDLYEMPAAGLGRFEIVLFLGVLYHVKYPLLALEIVCSLATEVAIVESFVIDGATWRDHQHDIPTLEFYETDELNGQFDNWFGPSVGALEGMCRAAGFARVQTLAVDRDSALIACYRTWEPEPAAPACDPPELLAVANVNTYGINFNSRRDQYAMCWFRTPADLGAVLSKEQLHLEVGRFGAPAVHLQLEESGAWRGTFRIPPGADPGWNPVRLRLSGSRFGEPRRIAIDLPLAVQSITLKDVADGRTWTPRRIQSGHATCWVAGLPENCDRHNVRAFLGAARLAVTYIGEPAPDGFRQVNAAWRPGLSEPAEAPKGDLPFRVECGGVASPSIPVRAE